MHKRRCVCSSHDADALHSETDSELISAPRVKPACESFSFIAERIKEGGMIEGDIHLFSLS